MKLLKRGLKVLLGILAGVVLVEFVLRGFFPEYSPESRMIWVPHPRYGSLHKPGADAICAGYGYRSTIRANSDGFRDREFKPKRPGVKRIVFIGDSFTEGAQVDVEKTFPRVLESLYRARNQEIECLNLAVQGHSNAQEYLILSDYIDKLDPDEVVLSFFVNNDVWDNSYDLNYKYPSGSRNRPLARLTDTGVEIVPFDFSVVEAEHRHQRMTKSLWRKTYFRNFIYDAKYKALYRFRGKKKLYKGTLNNKVYLESYDDEQWDTAWEITRRLIVMIRDLVESRGAKFLFVYIPDQVELYPERLKLTREFNPDLEGKKLDLNRPRGILFPFLRKEGIDFINLKEEFKKVPGDYYLKYDAHFNVSGHRRVAEILRGRIGIGEASELE